MNASPLATDSAVAGDRPLAGAVALVTGPLGRLGPTWVSALAGAGADVVGIDLSDRGGDALAAHAQQLGGTFRLEPADVADRASLDAVRDRIADLGPPAVLVNGAGIDQPPQAGATRHRIEDVPSDAFRGTLDVNLLGTFHALQAFGPAMRDAGRGSIVNVGSLYATVAPIP